MPRCNASGPSAAWCGEVQAQATRGGGGGGGGGGAPVAPAAPQLLPRCLCAELRALHPGTATLDATLAEAPTTGCATCAQPLVEGWPELSARLRLAVVGPLEILPPSLTLPWRCLATAALAPRDATFEASGGSGAALAWSSRAEAVATVDAAGRAAPRAAGETLVSAVDARSAASASAALRLVPVAALLVAPHAPEVRLDAPLTLRALFADAARRCASTAVPRCSSGGRSCRARPRCSRSQPPPRRPPCCRASRAAPQTPPSRA